MSDCIFCKIAQGDIPSAKVYEDELVYAFLDNSQTTPGHTLLIPKQHLAQITDYDEELAGALLSRLPKLARAILKAFPEAKGINIINNNGQAAYQTVFHSHFHLIPRYDENDGFAMKFEGQEFTDQEFQARADQIRQALEV